METTKEIIKRVIEKTFASLAQTHTVKVSNDVGLRIVYPCYRSGQTRVCEQKLKQTIQNRQTRISEQELKQVFIYFLQKETKLYYSVETPTKERYRFSGGGNVPHVCEEAENGRSGSIDLSIYESLSQVESGTPFANIEFKSGSPEPKDIHKDLLKLYKEQAKIGYFLHIVKSSDERTWKSLATKFKCQDFADTYKTEVSVYVYSLSKQICVEIFSDGTMK